MGLLHGHPSPGEPGTLVVTDAFPLPVEGTETTVLADSTEVTNYMIALAETLEATRSSNFMGWYHSHPFDVGAHSNAFLSATDVSTQLGWQLSEDAAGNPWLALVVDPLGGVAKGRPEIGAFRCYPPAYTPPKGTAPDGVVWADERARNARWGESCQAYYSLVRSGDRVIGWGVGVGEGQKCSAPPPPPPPATATPPHSSHTLPRRSRSTTSCPR